MRSQKQIDAATELVRKKRSTNYMTIEVSYNTKLVVPYEDGLAIMSAMKNAEVLEEQYGFKPRIFPIGREAFRTQFLAPEFYEDIKVAGLLDVTLEELHKARMKPLLETV